MTIYQDSKRIVGLSLTTTEVGATGDSNAAIDYATHKYISGLTAGETISSVTLDIYNASTNIKVGVYDSTGSGTSTSPNSLLAQGVAAVSVSNTYTTVTIPLTTTCTVPSNGIVWVGMFPEASVSFRQTTSSGTYTNSKHGSGVSGATYANAMPSTAWVSTGGDGGNGGYNVRFGVITNAKPTNVQDNSILVEKDTAKRYWFEQSTPITFEDDYDSSPNGWTTGASSVITMDAAASKINFNSPVSGSSNTNEFMYKSLGTTLSTTKFVARFKFQYNTFGSNGVWEYPFVLSAGTSWALTANQDAIGVQVDNYSRGHARAFYKDGSGSLTEGSAPSAAMVTGTVYYMELVIDPTTPSATVTIRTGSHTGTTHSTSTVTIPSTISGLNTLQHLGTVYTGGTGYTYDSELSETKIYNAVTSVTPATWTWENEPVYLGRGVFASGSTGTGGTLVRYNTIDYITIATLGNATDFGDSLKTGHDGGACGNLTRMVFGGGTGTATDTKLEYISFATLGNAVGFGAMVSGGGNTAACSDSTRGIWGSYTTLEYITIDTPATSISFGTLGNNHGGDPASCADATRGLWLGGEPSADTDAISYVTIQTPANSTDFGNLSTARRQHSAVADTTRGCDAGGYTGSRLTSIEYVTIQTPSNASSFGDLTVARTTAQGVAGDATRGVWGGGGNAASGGSTNTMDYITIASTGNATDFGDLTVSRYRASGASDYVK